MLIVFAIPYHSHTTIDIWLRAYLHKDSSVHQIAETSQRVGDHTSHCFQRDGCCYQSPDAASTLQRPGFASRRSPNLRMSFNMKSILACSCSRPQPHCELSIRNRQMLSWISDQEPNKWKKRPTSCWVQTHQQDPHEAQLKFVQARNSQPHSHQLGMSIKSSTRPP